MHQAASVEVTQRGGQGQPQFGRLINRQSALFSQQVAEGFWNILRWIDLLAANHIVSDLHHIMKVPRGFIATDVQNGYQTGMLARDGLETLNPEKLAVEWPVIFELGTMDDFNGPKVARDAARQPNLSIASLANAAHQFVIRNRGWRKRTDIWTLGHAALLAFYLTKIYQRSSRVTDRQQNTPGAKRSLAALDCQFR